MIQLNNMNTQPVHLAWFSRCCVSMCSAEPPASSLYVCIYRYLVVALDMIQAAARPEPGLSLSVFYYRKRTILLQRA